MEIVLNRMYCEEKIVKKKKTIDDFSLDELKVIKKYIDYYTSFRELKEDLLQRIEDKCDFAHLYQRFDTEVFESCHIFEPNELEVLKNNNIYNFQDLIDCDLDSLKGITMVIKEKLDWARNFYLFSFVDDKKQKLL